MYASLQSYFRSESESQARFVRLQSAFDNPMTEVYLLFYEAVLPTFTCLNLLLQREDPCIFLIADAIRSFLKKILAKFVTIQAIKSKSDVTTVAYECIDNQLDDDHITIGITTKSCLTKLFNDGSICDRDKNVFFIAVRAFYTEAIAQALKKFPFDDLVLKHAKFLNFEKREDCTFDNIEYICDNFHNVLDFTAVEMDKLQEEFTMYQLLEWSTIPESIWQQALVRENEEGNDRKAVL